MFPDFLGWIRTAALCAMAMFFGYTWGNLRGEASGAAKAELRINNQTNKAIEELTNDADKSRLVRRLCINSGGVYNFADGKCQKATAGE